VPKTVFSTCLAIEIRKQSLSRSTPNF